MTVCERHIRTLMLIKHVTEGEEWINLAQGMEKWRAFVNTGLNLRVLSNSWRFLTV